MDVHIVKDEGDKAVGDDRWRDGSIGDAGRVGVIGVGAFRRGLFGLCLRRGRLLNGKLSDLLPLAFVEDAEVLLPQIAYGMTLTIAHDNGNVD